MFLFSHLTYLTQLLHGSMSMIHLSVNFLGRGFELSRPKYHEFSIKLMIFPMQPYWDIKCKTVTVLFIISGFCIYGAAVVPDSGVGNTWQRLTLVLHEFLS